MNTLEEWVHSILSRQLDALNERYESENSAKVDVEPLLRTPADLRIVPTRLLIRLHAHLRGAVSEGAIWGALIACSSRPLPEAIANDLIDRGVAISALGHSRQSDTVQWRLASIYDEALLTLAVDLYTSGGYSLAALAELLRQFAGHTWMIETLLRKNASSPEKEQLYFAVMVRHQQVERFLGLLQHQESLRRAGSTGTTEDELSKLYDTRDTEIWLRLAANPRTPQSILRELAGLQSGERSTRIRRAARSNLRIRELGQAVRST